MQKAYKKLLLCGLCMLLTGCSAAQSRAETAAETEPVSTEPIEYVTVTPPEDGWTTQELMDVTYFCDHRLNYPLSVEDLGEDFDLRNYDYLMAKVHLEPGTLYYKGKSFARVTAIRPKKETMIYCTVLFPDVCKVEDVEPFVINGVKMNDSMDDVLEKLGEHYQYKSEDAIMYNDRETNETLYSFFFENGKLVHFNINFRFDIDSPLYQN